MVAQRAATFDLVHRNRGLIVLPEAHLHIKAYTLLSRKNGDVRILAEYSDNFFQRTKTTAPEASSRLIVTRGPLMVTQMTTG